MASIQDKETFIKLHEMTTLDSSVTIPNPQPKSVRFDSSSKYELSINEATCTTVDEENNNPIKIDDRDNDRKQKHEILQELKDAINSNNLELVKHLLKKGCPLDGEIGEEKYDLLLIACNYGRTDIVQIIIERSIHEDINLSENHDLYECLIQACKLNNSEIALLLIERAEANVYEEDPEYGRTAMHYAALNGSLSVMQVLADNGGSVHVRDSKEQTPLHLSCSMGFITIVEFLLSKNCLTDAIDNNGFSALHHACCSGVEHLVLLLLRKGVDVNAEDNKSRVPLYVAAEYGKETLIPILISYGALVDFRDKWNRTPLMVAARKGHTDVIKELICNGASLHCTDRKRNSAIELALENLKDSSAAALIELDPKTGDYLKEFLKTEEFPICKVLKLGMVKSAAAILDRMLVPSGEKSYESQSKLMLKYLDVDISNKLLGEKGYRYDKPYFVKIISDLRLESLASHSAVRLYVLERLKQFGYFFLFYKTATFSLFLFALAMSLINSAYQNDPLNYNNFFWTQVIRIIAELFVIFYWLTNVLTETLEIIQTFKHTYIYLSHKKKQRDDLKSTNNYDIDSNQSYKTQSLKEMDWDTFDYEDILSLQNHKRDSRADEIQLKGSNFARYVFARTYRSLKTFAVNNLILRFLANYFSDSFNWLDILGLLSILITIILRLTSSSWQWVFGSLTFLINCLRIFKLVNVYHAFGTYIRILISVLLYEIPQFALLFLLTLLIFAGTFFTSLRTPYNFNITTYAPGDMPKGTDNEVYREGFDNQIWWVFVLGLRVLLEAAPVYDEDYVRRLNWLSVAIFFVFLFLIIVIYTNLLIAQLTDRYAMVKRDAKKVVAWYRLNFIIQAQDTSLLSYLINFRKVYKLDSIILSKDTMREFYNCDSYEDFREMVAILFQDDFNSSVAHSKLISLQKYTARTQEILNGDLESQLKDMKNSFKNASDTSKSLIKAFESRYDHMQHKFDEKHKALENKIDILTATVEKLISIQEKQ